MVSPHVFSQLILIVFLWLVVIVHLTRSKRPVTAPATPTAEPEPSHPSTTAPPRRNEYRKNQAPFHAVRPAAPLVPTSRVGPPACPGTRLARAWPAAPHARSGPALVAAGRPQEGPDERGRRLNIFHLACLVFHCKRRASSG